MLYLPDNTLLKGGLYRIVRHINSGGFGCTYEGYNQKINMKVAIKEFFVKDFCKRDDDSTTITLVNESKRELMGRLREKFLEEGRALNKFDYPGIVHVYDVFEENDTVYYVMEYIDGMSLKELVDKRGHLSEAQTLKYIRQVCNALKFVHAHNRLHLDIKPGNIMIDAYDRAILIDFGTSKQYDEVNGENTSSITASTSGYAPLEQLNNNLCTFTPCTDIFSLAATMYKCLTGETPASILDVVEGKVRLRMPQNISQSTKNALRYGMAVRRDKRPQNVTEFLAILEGRQEAPMRNVPPTLPKHPTPPIEIGEAPRQSTRSGTPSDPSKPKSKKYIWLSILLGVVVLVAWLWPDRPPRGTVTIAVHGVEFRMIPVEGGSFTMGAGPMETEAQGDEFPAHKVTVDGFMMGETEVTQDLWVAVMGSNPSEFKGGNLPVDRVSWDDANRFISQLNSLTGHRFRLPTEAEWEYAARGGRKSKGYKYPGGDSPDRVGWYKDNSESHTNPVKSKRPNELKLYDMGGNVWEWCSDHEYTYTASAQHNPNVLSGPKRTRRGGCWGHDAHAMRSSNRGFSESSIQDSYIGLRLVLDE